MLAMCDSSLAANSGCREQAADLWSYCCTGWMRMCLQVLFFAPVNLLEPEDSFRRFAGRLIVSPVVRVLVFSKVTAGWCRAFFVTWHSQ